MPFDEKLAARIRKIVARRKGIDEKKMFGGICLMFNGNMLAPAVEKESSTDFDLLDVDVPHGSAEQRNRAEADRQHVTLVHDVQVMEAWGERGDEQAHAPGNVHAQRIADDPAEGNARQRRTVEDQAERGFLRVGVSCGFCRSIHSSPRINT